MKYMAEFCDLTVLYGLAGPHMGDLGEIENFLSSEGEIPNVQFVPVRPNLLARLLNKPNRSGFLVYSFYLAYRVWHKQAARIARSMHEAAPFDLIHYLCPIGYREPGFLWQIGAPYVWGPVGGLPKTCQLDNSERPWVARIKVHLKNLLNRLNVVTAYRVRKATASADIVIAATSENQHILEREFLCEPLLLQENAIPNETTKTKKAMRASPNQPLKLIWIGSLDWRKSPDLLLDALSQTNSTNWQLDVVGSGPLLAFCEAKSERLGLQTNVVFHGHIPRPQVERLLAKAHLHLITSMAEGNPTTLWEAMAAGVPTLSLDHCGMHDVICNQCGIRVPVTNYQETRDQFAHYIAESIKDPSILEGLSRGVERCRQNYTWDRRTRTWLKIYRDAIQLHKHNKDRIA